MRIDKLISQYGFGSRKEVKAILKHGVVSVDGEVVTNPQTRVNPETSVVYVGDVLIEYEKYVYVMMNKPAGVISASYDDEETTVCDLLDEKHQWFDLFPVGRLDKDTTGLIILTNDGGFAHRALSPKKHVEKVYLAQVDSELGQKEARAFENGITLDDGYRTMPAGLEILNDKMARVIIKEGKFHQIKRMFEALGVNVIWLKRTAFAGIDLDEGLAPGEFRRLSQDEMNIIVNLLSKD
ncbi:MAG: rRNA pseudouridine synthase [Clostridiales bacterium]|jgi:16S rRNA pseudouridine516 synthase|nr:rRNA pseudouridine synthase [Clostridiales bacterium]